MNLLKGYCFMGQKCSFAHTLDEWNPISCSCSKKICNYFHTHETKDVYATRLKLNTTNLIKPIYLRYGYESDDEDYEELYLYKKQLLTDSEEDKKILQLVNGVAYNEIAETKDSEWERAIRANDLETIKRWTLEKKEGYDATMMDLACSLGYFGLAQFLLFRRREGCTTNAMDEAAANGHMRIVRFLHLEKSGCSVKAIDNAAKNGHFAIVQFLCFYRDEGFTRDAYTSTNQDILDFLETSVKEKLRE
jgi:hypothetical protein